MIKAKQAFFLTSNLKGHGFHGDKATISYLTSEYYSLSVLCCLCAVFSLNRSSTSKVMAIYIHV